MEYVDYWSPDGGGMDDTADVEVNQRAILTRLTFQNKISPGSDLPSIVAKSQLLRQPFVEC